MTAFRRISLTATILTVVQIGSGGLVRATGSGDGCPDWPTCFGRWFPPLEYHAIIEWTHRFIGQFAIWSVVALAVVAFLRARTFFRLSALAVGGILVQAVLGAIVVASKGPNAKLAEMGASFVTFHIATAMLLVGLLVYLAARAYRSEPSATVAVSAPSGVRRAAAIATGAVFGLILIGAYVRGAGAGLAFADFPLMDARVVPALDSGPRVAHFVHRVAAVLVGVVIATFAVRARRARPRDAGVVGFSSAALAFFLIQILVGGMQVWTRLAPAPVAMHVFLASLIFASVVAALTFAYHPVPRAAAAGSSEREAEEPSPRWQTVKAYVALTKPRIVVLLLVTTVPTMVLAARGWPGTWLVLATMLGGTLAAGAANAINCYFDRDIDAIMRRTRSRPLPAHRVEPRPALAFAVVLAATSFAFMTWTVNLLAAALTLSAVLFYVFVYTLGLKRSTPQNIVVGGAAGAVPVLVGWAAVTGRVEAPALLLFLVIFLWTPPHFWALAVRHAQDYADAGVPMMPVVAGAAATYRQIVVYTFATVGVTLALFPVAQMGALYLVTATLLGAWFIRHSVLLLRTGTPRAAMGLFKFSISYLALLFAAVGLDSAIASRA